MVVPVDSELLLVTRLQEGGTRQRTISHVNFSELEVMLALDYMSPAACCPCPHGSRLHVPSCP